MPRNGGSWRSWCQIRGCRRVPVLGKGMQDGHSTQEWGFKGVLVPRKEGAGCSRGRKWKFRGVLCPGIAVQGGPSAGDPGHPWSPASGPPGAPGARPDPALEPSLCSAAAPPAEQRAAQRERLGLWWEPAGDILEASGRYWSHAGWTGSTTGATGIILGKTGTTLRVTGSRTGATGILLEAIGGNWE